VRSDRVQNRQGIRRERKHADAANVDFELDLDRDGITVGVQDNDTGFAVPANGRDGRLGLATMRERAMLAGGWFRIRSIPDDGTSVAAWCRPAPMSDAGTPDGATS
jgi:signal transduction histidine kinase